MEKILAHQFKDRRPMYTRNRVKVLTYILNHPNSTFAEVGRGTGLSEATVWFHAFDLKKDGLVEWQPKRRRTLRALRHGL